MQDDFNLDEFDNNEENQITNKDKFNNVLAYIPFLNIWLLFSGNTWTKKVNKRYTRQWITLFLLYIVVFFIAWALSFKISFFITLFYFASVVFFAAKAYNEMYVEIEFIEKIMAQFEPKSEKKEIQINKNSTKNSFENEFNKKDEFNKK